MEFLAESILGGFIIRFLGVNTRYYLLKFFKKSLKKEDLLGDPEDAGSQFGNGVLNAIVGFCTLFALFYLVGSIFF